MNCFVECFTARHSFRRSDIVVAFFAGEFMRYHIVVVALDYCRTS